MLIIIQARMSSTRLPKKVLKPLGCQPLIVRLFGRLMATGYQQVVGVGMDTEYESLLSICKSHGVPAISGPLEDVMERLIMIAAIFGEEDVVRVTADNPLTSPKVLKLLVKQHLKHKNDYTYIEGPPPGTKCEVINVEALKRLHAETKSLELRENMTPALKTMDKVQKVLCPVEWVSHLRLTVDTPEDYNFVRAIYNHWDEPPDIDELIPWILNHYSETGQRLSQER